MDERKAITLKISPEQKAKLIKYQGDFQSNIGKRPSQAVIIDMALDWFLSLEHDWTKTKEYKGN